MRERAKGIAGLLFLTAVLAPAAVATSGDRLVPPVQEAVVNLEEPTRIADAIVMGPILIVHDDRMYTGEPCTTVYRFGPREVLTVFACKARKAAVAEKFVLRLGRDPMVGCAVLTEFQFAGDSEAHGVPVTVE